jgi:hypothetical protein
VVLTTIGAGRRIGTNRDETLEVGGWTADSDITADSSQPVGGSSFVVEVTADFEYSVQADFYSPDAESWAMSAELLWRDKIAWYSMPDGMKPLYSEGRQQLPIVAAEAQWIQRWTLTLVLDYQPTWSQPTQAATAIGVIPEPIDVFYPPYPPGWTADSDTVTADSKVDI